MLEHQPRSRACILGRADSRSYYQRIQNIEWSVVFALLSLSLVLTSRGGSLGPSPHPQRRDWSQCHEGRPSKSCLIILFSFQGYQRYGHWITWVTAEQISMVSMWPVQPRISSKMAMRWAERSQCSVVCQTRQWRQGCGPTHPLNFYIISDENNNGKNKEKKRRKIK